MQLTKEQKQKIVAFYRRGFEKAIDDMFEEAWAEIAGNGQEEEFLEELNTEIMKATSSVEAVFEKHEE